MNVAFTIDTYCLDLLNQAGKNKSKTVRMAIVNYLGDPLKAENTELQERYRDKILENKDLIGIVQLQKAQIERLRKEVDSIDRRNPNWLERIRNLFYKHRE